MKKVKTYNPDTLEEIEVEFDDFHYELAEVVKNKLEVLEPTPLIFFEDKICIGILKPKPSERKFNEKFTDKYRILIEKIKSD